MGIVKPPTFEPQPCPACGAMVTNVKSDSGWRVRVPDMGTYTGTHPAAPPRGVGVPMEYEPSLDRHVVEPCGCHLTRDQADALISAAFANRPTPVSNFRIPLDIKAAAQAKAQQRGETLTDVVVRALDRYAKRKG